MRFKKTYLIVIFALVVLLVLYWLNLRALDDTDAEMTRKKLSLNAEESRMKELEDQIGVRLREIKNNLAEIKRIVFSQEIRNKISTQVNLLTQLQLAINPSLVIKPEDNVIDEDIQIHRVNPLKEICPEQYQGKTLEYDYPLFRKGFSPVKCSDFKPMESLITLILQMPSKHNPVESLKNVAEFYPNIKVILMTEAPLNADLKQFINTLNIKFINHVVTGGSQSAAWNTLVDDVSTPYVLIAPSITLFNDDVILERLVRVLSYHENVAVAGGAIRNPEGKWDIGCEQVTFRNWTTWYKGGYHRSFNECVVCDHLKGPFAAKTQLLKKIKFDANMKTVLFHDFFWRVRQNKDMNVIVSCPDVMFNVLNTEKEDIEFLPFVNQYEIHKIVESNGRERWYGCRKGRPWASDHHCKRVDRIALSPTTMENLADAIKFFMNVCEEIGAFCQLKSGTFVGAVKLNGILPWERDGDMGILSANFSAMEKQSERFKQAGYSLVTRDKPQVNKDGVLAGGYMAFRAGLWVIEILGLDKMETYMLAARGVPPTRVQFVGQWVNVARNPGLFIRNHYGNGIYEHVEHWRGLGHKTSWLFYKTGSFRECPRPGHSACLDQYHGDGNMQFRRYPH